MIMTIRSIPGRSSVGRRTEAERGEEEAEALLGGLVVKVADAEDPLLQLDIVDPDRTGSHFISIENKVVQVSLCRILFHRIDVLRLWHAEHVVGGLPLTTLLIVLEEGKSTIQQNSKPGLIS